MQEVNTDDCEILSNREWWKLYRDSHKEQIAKSHHEWYERNSDKVKAYTKKYNAKKKLGKMNMCSHCGKRTGNEVIKYKNSYYCCHMCLADYLINMAEQDIQIVDKSEVV